ncbi:hypothetical protein V8E51_019833 [Hyaloscypha variabilis]
MPKLIAIVSLDFLANTAASLARACHGGSCLESIGGYTDFSNGIKGNIGVNVIASGTTVYDSARDLSEDRGRFQTPCEKDFSYQTDDYTSWYLVSNNDDYIFNNKPPQNTGYEYSAKVWCNGIGLDVKANCWENPR